MDDFLQSQFLVTLEIYDPLWQLKSIGNISLVRQEFVELKAKIVVWYDLVEIKCYNMLELHIQGR